jgi:transposase
MGEAEGAGRRIRRSWLVAEKRRIVELTLAPCASVARVAMAHGVNANQVFVWRRAFERGELVESAASATALLPVMVSVPDEAAVGSSGQPEPPATSGSIHIEFPGRALISVESGADPALVRSILESLRR